MEGPEKNLAPPGIPSHTRFLIYASFTSSAGPLQVTTRAKPSSWTITYANGRPWTRPIPRARAPATR